MKVGKRFLKSPFCTKKSGGNVLVVGFIGNNPVMFHTEIFNGKFKVAAMNDRCEIGEGDIPARTMLNQREYVSTMEFEEAAYLVYEAKRFSEFADGVGDKTQMMIQRAMPQDAKPTSELCANYLTREAIMSLEGLREKFYLQKVTSINRFPDRYFRGRYPFSKPSISSIDQSRSVTPAAIAGETLKV